DVEEFKSFLQQAAPRPPAKNLIWLLEHGRLLPSEELVEKVSSMLEGNDEFELLDNQDVAFEVIRHNLMNVSSLTKRQVFVVKGGPGTGKSVIAIRLLAELLKAKRMAFFVAPNKAFRQTVIDNLTRGNDEYREDGADLFRSSWNFYDIDYDKGAKQDVLIVD